jgi:hypothetical protein
MTEQNQKQLGTTLWAIAAQSQAIELLKLHKKGLMQQLFPSVEEVKR